MWNVLHNICRPIPILVAKVWRWNLGYAKNLQAKYFTGKNIPIYGIPLYLVVHGIIILMFLIHRARPYHRMKLMLVGYAARGKTTLLQKISEKGQRGVQENWALQRYYCILYNFSLDKYFSKPAKLPLHCRNIWENKFHPCHNSHHTLYVILIRDKNWTG